MQNEDGEGLGERRERLQVVLPQVKRDKGRREVVERFVEMTEG